MWLPRSAVAYCAVAVDTLAVHRWRRERTDRGPSRDAWDIKPGKSNVGGWTVAPRTVGRSKTHCPQNPSFQAMQCAPSPGVEFARGAFAVPKCCMPLTLGHVKLWTLDERTVPQVLATPNKPLVDRRWRYRPAVHRSPAVERPARHR